MIKYKVLLIGGSRREEYIYNGEWVDLCVMKRVMKLEVTEWADNL